MWSSAFSGVRISATTRVRTWAGLGGLPSRALEIGGHLDRPPSGSSPSADTDTATPTDGIRSAAGAERTTTGGEYAGKGPATWPGPWRGNEPVLTAMRAQYVVATTSHLDCSSTSCVPCAPARALHSRERFQTAHCYCSCSTAPAANTVKPGAASSPPIVQPRSATHEAGPLRIACTEHCGAPSH